MHQSQGRYGFLVLPRHLPQGNPHTDPPIYRTALLSEDTSHISLFKESLGHHLGRQETRHLTKTGIFYLFIAS